MKLFVNANSLDIDLGKDDESGYIGFDAMRELQSAIQTELQDFDAQCRPSGISAYANDRTSLVTAAFEWNHNIRKKLEEALDAWQKSDKHLDNEVTNRLYKAARCADNNFSAYGDYGILMDNGCGFPTFTTLLTAEQVDDIQENPQNYAIVLISVT